jgi:MSHA biogenesis protein MshK
MAASLNKFLTVATLLCVGAPALALESLPDPTKPAVDIPYESEVGKPAESAVVLVPKKEGLQSIIISPQHRAAVINGEMIELGGKIGDATLVEVNKKSVVLQGAQGKRVMELFPGVHLSKAEGEFPAGDKSPPKLSKQVIKPKAAYKNSKSSKPVHTEQD